MLKVALGVVVLAVTGVILLINQEIPDRFGYEFVFPEDTAPPNQKIGADLQEFKIGARVYQRHIRNRPFAVVRDIDNAHEFPSGIDAGVLIEFKDRTQVWVRRRYLDRWLIED